MKIRDISCVFAAKQFCQRLIGKRFQACACELHRKFEVGSRLLIA
jgi:hypothetical protein